MKAQEFFRLLQNHGFDFFTGVPCTYLKAFLSILTKLDSSQHVAATREDIAVGLAVGAYMGGKHPVVYMQNSGLGYSLEAFASLNMIYRIPVLVLLTLRGPDDAGWEEHLVMGKHTEALLAMFDLPHSNLGKSIDDKKMVEIGRKMRESGNPYFLIVGKEALT